METFITMIFITEKRGRPVGSKNKSKGTTRLSSDLTNEEQRMLDILSIFAQKGFIDFAIGFVDNEGIMDSKDQNLISLYKELVSTIKNQKDQHLPDNVIIKLYNTFSDMNVLYKSQKFGKYLRGQGYSPDTLDDLDIPKDQIRKLKKDFDSLPEPDLPTSKPSSDGRHPITGRKSYTKKDPEQKKQEVVNGLTNYLKSALNLDDNEIKSRIDLLLSPKGTQTSKDTEGSEKPNDGDYWTTSTTLNEQILRDFKRFL